MALSEVLLNKTPDHDSHVLIAAALVSLFLYLIGNTVYQLYLSPLARFPGPRLAAVTLWYEIYYDVFKWGRYYVEVEKMHQEYGSIVRINPFELHVSDPDFIDTLYTRAAPRDKHEYMTRQFGNDDVSFSTIGSAHHRTRRAAISPFFSKQRVLGLQDLIWTHVEKLCTRFEEFKVSGRPLPTGDAFGCLTADVIIEYSMGIQQNALDDPDFAPLFTQAVKKFASLGVITKHIPWLHKVLRAIPQHWIAKLSPEYGAMLAFREMNTQRVKEAFERNEKQTDHTVAGDQLKEPTTIFDTLITSSLPPSEKSLSRLSQESQIIIGAALDTTAHALNTTLFHLLSNPPTLATLCHELSTALPNPRAHPPLSLLEPLPYLTAVINEGLRLSHGLSARNARLAHTPLVYKSHLIPAYTPISMSAPLTHHNESLFPDSHSFIPERWIRGTAPDGRPLEKYLMAFGRGARRCVGENLARAEMYIVLAALVGRFEMGVVKGGRADVDMYRDLFLPGVQGGGQGVRVRVE